jgi:hypothetical protein
MVQKTLSYITSIAFFMRSVYTEFRNSQLYMYLPRALALHAIIRLIIL